MSNFDLLKWCKYLKIPINVLSRDEKEKHKHKLAIFIYNLEPSYMSGSHWVCTYTKNNINYFNAFCLQPFQEIVNHAKKTKSHIDTSIRSITKYVYNNLWILLFVLLDQMNKGNGYFDLLQAFDINDINKNERLIENYFKNI